MQKHIFVTGIGTEIGKTVVSAIITESLQADYWKPIQAGELHCSDTDKVKGLITNTKTAFHQNSYSLKEAMSPHAAAKRERVTICIKDITRPQTQNRLVIEGAGGLLVPLNDKDTMLDLIHQTDKIVVVSQNYLGSINHTLLTLDMIKTQGYKHIGIVFNGGRNKDTESIIIQKTGVFLIGGIEQYANIDRCIVSKYATKLEYKLTEFINLSD